MAPRALIQISPSDLAKMSDGQTVAVMRVVERRHQQEFVYAMAGMIGGTACFLMIIVAFVYLIMEGHTHAAGGVLGTGVLGIVLQMFKGRLTKTP